MAKKARPRRQEHLIRNVTITGVDPSLYQHVEGRRVEEREVVCRSWLVLHGKLDEAVAGILDVEFTISAEDAVSPGRRPTPSVGAVVSLKPVVAVVLSFAHREFDRLWTMAVGGHLRFAYFVMTPPFRRRALVTSVGFSGVKEE